MAFSWTVGDAVPARIHKTETSQRRTRRAPTDRAARFIDDRSHSVSGRFSISTTRGQHHVPSLHAGRFLRDEKASSGLPLQPTDLSALLTEQIAHFSPLLETTAGLFDPDQYHRTRSGLAIVIAVGAMLVLETSMKPLCHR
jgi:hypothetical protein